MPTKTTRGGAGRCGPARPLRIRGTSPSAATCRRLLVAHGVPEHIRRHSGQVARVARQVSAALRVRGERIDAGLIEAAALLHDIAKAPCLESRLDHAAEGGRVLRELGLAGVAAVVERHVHLGPWDPRGPVTEAEVVNYADKRVLYEGVVSLEERFRDLILRYGKGRRRIRGAHPAQLGDDGGGRGEDLPGAPLPPRRHPFRAGAARRRAPVTVPARIGVYGGTFNPVHMAHLVLAEDVRERLGLERVLFVPANLPPHKGEALPGGAERLALVRLAIRGNPGFGAIDLEVRRGGAPTPSTRCGRSRGAARGSASCSS